MEYNNNNNNNQSNVSNVSNVSNDSQETTLGIIGYFYTTTFTINQSFIDRLLSFNNTQSIPQSIPQYEQSNYLDSEISPNSPYSNPILFNSSNFRLLNTNENNENNPEIYYDLSDTFFPTVNFIERIFNDYIENKNKLNDEEYKNNVEKIHEILEECPVCFSSSETTIKIKKCNHIFCEDCIQKWLKDHKNTCPICRVNVIIERENSNSNGNNNNENCNE